MQLRGRRCLTNYRHESRNWRRSSAWRGVVYRMSEEGIRLAPWEPQPVFNLKEGLPDVAGIGHPLVEMMVEMFALGAPCQLMLIRRCYSLLIRLTRPGRIHLRCPTMWIFHLRWHRVPQLQLRLDIALRLGCLLPIGILAVCVLVTLAGPRLSIRPTGP